MNAKLQSIKRAEQDTAGARFKSLLGWIVGFLSGTTLCLLAIALGLILLFPDLGSGRNQAVIRQIVFGAAIGGGIGLGGWTSSLFRKTDFRVAKTFQRVSIGLRPRVPVAMYASWALTYLSYSLFMQSDVDAYSQNWAQFTLILFLPPTIGTVVLILFRWATIDPLR